MEQKSFFRNIGRKVVAASALALGASQAFAGGDPTTAVVFPALAGMNRSSPLPRSLWAPRKHLRAVIRLPPSQSPR